MVGTPIGNLAKKFEEVVRGTISEVRQRFERGAPRGEFTLVFAGATAKPASPPSEYA